MNQISRAIGIRNRFDLMSAALAFLVSIPLVLVIVALLDREMPISYRAAYALEKTVPIGGQMTVRFEVVRYKVCPSSRVDRYVAQNSQEHAVEGYTKGLGGEPTATAYERIVVVPETLSPGPAAYFVRITYACNWLQVFWPLQLESPRIRFEATPNPNTAFGPLTPLPIR